MEERQMITNERYKDLLIGTLYELYELKEGSIGDYFANTCDTIGFTEGELAYLGFERR